MVRSPAVIAIYATLSLTLGGQWIAAKLGVTAVPALELSTMRFAIAAIGAAIVIVGGQGGGDEASALRLRGDLMEAGAAAGWGASLTIGAVVLRRERVLGYVALMVTIGAVLLLPLGLFAQGYRDL